ncbi:hypothetical protein IV203_037553 [Nitzschia inconspicua]|uniref:DUF6824 domain-containing protein n=1 Tax=Nitzschia inconspicua TaxID=303405 RepID=A0A9K3LPT4_9STRA|nr:hypothetical protein IV203_037553 [Nitzschia inconspicua]
MLFGTVSNNQISNAVEQSIHQSKMSREDSSKKSNSVFDSADFRAFLSTEIVTANTSVFKSKDSFTNLFQSKDSVSDLFKSKDSFSSMFASRDWNMPFAQTKQQSSSDPASHDDWVARKIFEKNEENDVKVPALTAMPASKSSEGTASVAPDLLKSREWAASKVLGAHVEVPYSQGIFSKESTVSKREDRKLPPAMLPRTETKWNELFMSQLVASPASPSTPTTPAVVRHVSRQLNEGHNLFSDAPVIGGEQLLAEYQPQIGNPSVSVEIVTGEQLPTKDQTKSGVPSVSTEGIAPMQPPAPANTGTSGTTKKRKRAPRKKVVPKKKVYVEPQSLDILCGRGGRSNHHSGNKRYRDEVENLKEWYSNIDSKDSKTDLSQCLVDYVQSYGARFLEHDEHGWYIVDNVVARRKASQALREDTDPEKRRAKRQRFLAKQARLQEGARNQKQGGG